ncbi:hypothetical protein CNBG_1203 [Cryptococcus deuterogattii R265]|uniref:uncharacterized protein n=1 Tax=Cryptococcus deuterogattii (strain R265) TaxID=294750 RepID=UPI001934E26F|nr:hypothetical protein CNBG_1203 [Cryptococcus deuterogattii R265]
MDPTKLDTVDTSDKEFSAHVEDTVAANKTGDDTIDPIELVRQQYGDLYAEALERYGQDDSIDPEEEKKLKRKLDMRIIPLLGVCYFFYYVDKTTLSYAAIFGIKEDLNLGGSKYSWLSSIFYFGWLGWAIPSNLLLQRSPPAYYLAFNIFLWGAFLMCQAAAKNYATIAALRVISGAAEAIADPCFMLITSMYYTREEQPSRISSWYAFNGLGVAGGGLIGYGIGQIKGALATWRYEFLIVGAVCSFWAICLGVYLPNSPVSFRGFSRDERVLMIARMRKNQTGIESKTIKWDQIVEAMTDYKTYMFLLLGLLGTLETALLGIPQGVLVMIWIGAGAIINGRLPKNSRTYVCALFMLPTIAGSLGFLLAPANAYVGRLICFYLTGSYQASFVLSLSLITSNTGGQSKKMIVSGMIWLGACVGNIAGPFFYKTNQAPKYTLGIGSILVCNCLEFLLFFAFRYAFIWENRKKEKFRESRGAVTEEEFNATAFSNLTDKQNPNFEYVY